MKWVKAERRGNSWYLLTIPVRWIWVWRHSKWNTVTQCITWAKHTTKTNKNASSQDWFKKGHCKMWYDTFFSLKIERISFYRTSTIIELSVTVSIKTANISILYPLYLNMKLKCNKTIIYMYMYRSDFS